MRAYEVVVIVHPDLDDLAFKEQVEKVKNWITEAGGTISKVDSWGKRKLAYRIRNQKEGQYVVIKADMPPLFCSQLERNLRLTESVMRFLITADEV